MCVGCNGGADTVLAGSVGVARSLRSEPFLFPHRSEPRGRRPIVAPQVPRDLLRRDCSFYSSLVSAYSCLWRLLSCTCDLRDGIGSGCYAVDRRPHRRMTFGRRAKCPTCMMTMGSNSLGQSPQWARHA